ncbi:hypothetical protein LWC35_38385 [Pseudonocardia kujensis]|uniref:hypothetical protein n=1 Tax=Pseudonocardia kujensis TaxID=1128675 RepID=UPI001E4F2F94|nr:hypothetical protein [Pseudonocardia kujensis]MCE0768723.1 hypothetical protein [Pseudonocardia kujensis]
MPIRSPRGRAAAYRAVWAWPLRTPLRLGVTVLVVLALAVLVSLAVGALRPPAQAPAAQRSGTTTTTGVRAPASPTPTALPPVAALTPTTLPLSAAPAEALQVAQNWAAAWATHPAGTTNQQWVDGLIPYTTPEYVGTLTGVDPANIPATRVTGSATATQVSPASVVADVPTDALTLQVTVVDTEAGWRVSGYDRA